MVAAKLFVRSIRIPVVSYEMPNMSGGGHYCSAGYRTQSTSISLSEEDRQAKQVLKTSGIKFEVVDLSESKGRKRIGAWLGGLKNTPTLLVEGHGKTRYEGLKAISDYVHVQRKLAGESAHQTLA